MPVRRARAARCYLACALAPLDFLMPTECTMERYGRVALAALHAEEEPDPRYRSRADGATS